MSEQQTIDITDPKVWNNLPMEQRFATTTELQSILVTQCLLHSGFGELLVKRRDEGKDLSKEVLLIEHRLEQSVSVKDRKAMGDMPWRVRLWSVSKKPPVGTSKRFAHWMQVAKKNPLPEGDDLFCIICSNKQVFFVTVPLSKYLEAIAPKEAPLPIDAPIVPADAVEGPDTFENIVALIKKAAPQFEWDDWLRSRIEDGTALVLPGGIFNGIRKRVSDYIRTAHAAKLAAETADRSTT